MTDREECSFEGCPRPRNSGGLCRAHARQQAAGKELAPIRAWTNRKEAVPDGERACSRCGRQLPNSEFHVTANVADGLSANCKSCTRMGNIKSKYGITMDQYLELLEQQCGGCAICHRSCPTGRELCVDHDHRCCPGKRSCGKCVRGLLCAPCNTGVGQLGDSPQRLHDAADYLRKHGH